MKFFISLGTATVSLLFLTAAALAQQAATAVPSDTCYVEWENDVRVSLASLCREAEVSDRPSSSRATESRSTAETRPPAVAVEVVSNVGSAVYVNGVLVSPPNRTQLYPSPTPNVDSVTRSHYSPIGRSTTVRSTIGRPTIGRPTIGRNRRYVRYQRFYPYSQPVH